MGKMGRVAKTNDISYIFANDISFFVLELLIHVHEPLERRNIIMMIVFRGVVLAIFFLLELGALTALGYWGFHLDKGWYVKLAAGIGAPLLAAVVWGTFIAPKASVPVSVGLRIPLQLLVFGAAAAALYSSGHPKLAAVFLVLAIIELILNYTLKL